jgi:FtsP/CotA-like multicopper oxidase with cupredoxin domain
MQTDQERPPMSPPIGRRRLITAAAATTVSGLVSPLLPPDGNAETAAPIVLTAGRRTIEVNGRAASVFSLTQPDGTHGLITEAGTRFKVQLRNALAVETLVHWHGLMPPYRQDGVPGLSAPAVAPGGSASYDFPLDFAGTFWMHSHQGLQEQSLLSAPLIIHGQNAKSDRQEVVLMLHDFAYRSPEEIYAQLRKPPGPASSEMPGMDMGSMSAMPMDLNDVSYDAFLANDRTLDDPQIVRVGARGRILLRIINASASSNFIIDLGGATARLTQVDGRPIQPLSERQFPIAMAQRLDLEIELPPDRPVLPVFAVLEGTPSRTGIILATANAHIPKFSTRAPDPAPQLDLRLEKSLRATNPLTARRADRIHQIALTGSMASYRWGLNGVAYGHDKPLMVAKGERVELVMTNHTMMAHPMHLHGHVFQVVAVDGQRFPGANRDTVLVPAMRSVTVAFDADNPGRWAFHCHNLYHMEAGMMTTVDYETV